MFTGIIEEVGILRRVTTRGENKILEIETSLELREGDSLAVSGACLTIVEVGEDWVKAAATGETNKRTILGDLHAGSRINLERALTLQKPLGGHLVQGHVDEKGKVAALKKTQDAWHIEVAFSKGFADLVVDQGSVAIDGVSLTVLKKLPGPKLLVNIIPETLRRTTLSGLRVGDKVNLEFDIIAKYVREHTRP
ncbi:MAG: riboflavin synthase [Candidatus Stahlbacteria bacterium]|nr:MAG: riboflavin synthase [Candidatus Stahlbacteria bacterium]